MNTHVNIGEAGGISPSNVAAFRHRAHENGYRPIRVRANSKAPLARDWQQGEPIDVLEDVRPDAPNTGLLLAGLRCVDIDVDDKHLVLRIMKQVILHLPTDPLIRRRVNSPRMSLLYRAAEGQPAKLVVKGSKGKVEVLGAGQQVVAHGQHPTGAPLLWVHGRGPDTVRVSDVPEVSERQIRAFLHACVQLLESPEVSTESPLHSRFLAPGFSGPPAAVFGDLTKALASGSALAAGIPTSHWYADLNPQAMTDLLRACLDVLENRTSDTRERWLRVLFAVADAERLGCQQARQLALEWSMRGASWTNERDFNTAWNSFKPEGGITIGSLLSMAQEAGLDLSSWRDLASAASTSAQHENKDLLPKVTGPSNAQSGLRALCAADLLTLPAKRQWLHGTDLIRGAVSLLVAPGGRGKSSWLIALALACVSNKQILGAHIFGGPLRVLLISAEDPTAEVALRLRAAMNYHAVTNPEVAGLFVIGAERWGIPFLSQSRNGPVKAQAGWDELTRELERLRPDVLIIDPLISLMGGVSQNDNAAAALFMGGLVRLAADRRIAILVAHHASKGRDPLSAESAMGAASFVNLARIALGIEPLSEKDAGSLGLPPWEARYVFRIVGTKQNLSPPADTDRWFRLVSIEVQNAEPPIYPNGDKVAVVEVFKAGSGPKFSPDLMRVALRVVDAASLPLSPAKNSRSRYAVPPIASALAPHRGGRCSDVEAEAVLKHLLESRLVKVDKVKIPRAGARFDERDGLVLTPAGRSLLEQDQHGERMAPQPPQSPASSMRDDAGGGPLWGPATPKGGVGGMRGAPSAGDGVAPSHAHSAGSVPSAG